MIQKFLDTNEPPKLLARVRHDASFRTMVRPLLGLMQPRGRMYTYLEEMKHVER